MSRTDFDALTDEIAKLRDAFLAAVPAARDDYPFSEMIGSPWSVLYRVEKYFSELETQLHDQVLVTFSIQALAYNALRTDGAHHKQWFLEQILQLVSKPEEYERVIDQWKAGIEP